MQSRGPPKNAEIRVSDVRVIGTNKESLGVMPTRQALDIAADEDLDLVLVVPDADPPVARIVNYGKFMYEQDKKRYGALLPKTGVYFLPDDKVLAFLR